MDEEPGEHLFRRESGRMTAALTHIFGVNNLALAEDVVQDAFCRALEVWKYRGIPDNPSAWLMKTARNRALDVLRRERRQRPLGPDLDGALESEWTLVPTIEQAFRESSIEDDQLRMMFSCCQPRLPEQTQVALILHLLCGFSVEEVAGTFLTSYSTMSKRITRAKKVLAASKRLFDLADREFLERLSAVQRALYLLFNEGYHGASPQSAVRVDLCREAMRLAKLLTAHRLASTPATLALRSLMCLNAARLPARIDESGNLHSLFEQDRSIWDAKLMAEGRRLLDRSATGHEVTEYHIEAAIAAVHADATGVQGTDWQKIVALYDKLLTIRPSPVVALNRAIAFAQYGGAERGLEELQNIPDRERLAEYPFYPAALGELELRLGRHKGAREHFLSALRLARNPAEQRFFQGRIDACAELAPS